MRVLVEPNTNRERAEILELLLANGIRCHETDSGFLGPAAIWVDETDFEKAWEIASSVEARHSRQATEEWSKDWTNKYHGSYKYWLLQQFRKPGTWMRLVLLVLVVGIFLVYPIIHIFRR